MKLERLLRRIYCEEWAIIETMFDQIVRIVESHINGTANHAEIAVKFDEQEELAPEMVGDVAVIPIRGVIGKGVSVIEKSSGMVDLNDVAACLEWVSGDDQVASVVLDFDSPGGTIGGVPETAEAVLRLNGLKPVVSFCDGLCCSAAYWIASQSSAIYASPSSSVGSVGVYIPILDQSRRYAMAGVDPDIIKSGKYKGAGFPGTSLTDEQRDLLRERVALLHGVFKTAVVSGRGTIKNEAMEGQEFFASQALDEQLIDRIGCRSEAIRESRELAKVRSQK